MRNRHYKKDLKIKTLEDKEVEGKNDNLVSNNKDTMNFNEENHYHIKRRLNTDINDDNQDQVNPIFLRKNESNKYFRINKREKEKEHLGNEIENKEIQNNRMKIYKKTIINKPYLPELNNNNDIFSNNNQKGILYYNSTKNIENKRFEYPENINKIKIANQSFKKSKINYNQDNDNNNFNVFEGNDNLEENLNINEIQNNKLSIYNKNERKNKNSLNFDENLMNKKENKYLIHYNSTKNYCLKDNTENNNNKIVKEVDSKDNKSPIRQKKILSSEVLNTVDNQEERYKKFRNKFQINSNERINYIKPIKNIFHRKFFSNRLININNDQKTYKNNNDEEKKDYRKIGNQNEDNKIENNIKKINKELSIENNDKKIKGNKSKIENKDNNIDYYDIKINDNDYKSKNKDIKIKNKNNNLENRYDIIDNYDIKIDNNNFKIDQKESRINRIKKNFNKIKDKDNKIENRDINNDYNDIKIEKKEIKIENDNKNN